MSVREEALLKELPAQILLYRLLSFSCDKLQKQITWDLGNYQEDS